MFRWHMKHDIDLAREVVAVRPRPGLTDWNMIAANLKQLGLLILKDILKGALAKNTLRCCLATTMKETKPH